MIIAGLLITFSLTNPHLFFLSWFAFLPVMAALKNQRLKKSFLNGWVLGIVIMIGSSYWLYYPLIDFSGLPGISIIIILALLFILMGIFYGLWALFFVYINGKKEIHPFLFACSWIAFEYVRFKVIPAYPLGFIGYTQIEWKSLIQFADTGGMFLVSFILLLINVYIFKLLKKRSFKFVIPLFLIIILIFSYGGYKYKHYNNKQYEELAIGIVNTRVPQINKWKSSWIEKNIDELITAANKFENIKLIIGPETSLTFDIVRNEYYREKFLKKTDEIESYMQVGAQSIKKDEEGKYNSVFLISPTGEIVDRYNKRKLVPFGEYIPLYNMLDILNKIDVESLKAGEEEKLLQAPFASWATSICSEIFYPLLYTGRFDFIINHSNEGWYRNSNLHQQMWAASVFRAVEYRCSVVRAGNHSWSGVIMPSGNYNNIYKKGEDLSLKIKLNNESTLYQKWKNYIGWGAIIIVILSLFTRIYFNRKS